MIKKTLKLAVVVLGITLFYSCAVLQYEETLLDPNPKDWVVVEVNEKCIIVQNSADTTKKDHWIIKKGETYYTGQFLICPDYLRNTYTKP